MAMRQRLGILSMVLLCGLVLACTNPNSAPAGPHGTVFLRDGSSYSGSVSKSTPAEITLLGDDQTSHTFPMQNVKSIEYGDTAEPLAATATQRDERREQREHEDHYHPEEAAIRTKTYVVPVGAEIHVRTEETVDSGRASEGQAYAAEVSRDVLDANAEVVIPRGSNAQLVIRSASHGGRFRGTSDLVLDLVSVSVDGRQYQLSAASIEERGKAGIGKNERTAKFVGGGALLGTVIGAIAGHGKGAAIGAASGAVAGGAAQLLTRGGSIHVPAESLLTFRLDQPLRVAAVQ